MEIPKAGKPNEAAAVAARERRHAILKLYRQTGSYRKTGALLGISGARVQVLVKRAEGEERS